MDKTLLKMSREEKALCATYKDQLKPCSRCGAMEVASATITKNNWVTVGAHCPNNHNFRHLVAPSNVMAAMG